MTRFLISLVRFYQRCNRDGHFRSGRTISRCNVPKNF